MDFRRSKVSFAKVSALKKTNNILSKKSTGFKLVYVVVNDPKTTGSLKKNRSSRSLNNFIFLRDLFLCGEHKLADILNLSMHFFRMS